MNYHSALIRQLESAPFLFLVLQTSDTNNLMLNQGSTVTIRSLTPQMQGLHRSKTTIKPHSIAAQDREICLSVFVG